MFPSPPRGMSLKYLSLIRIRSLLPFIPTWGPPVVSCDLSSRKNSIVPVSLCRLTNTIIPSGEELPSEFSPINWSIFKYMLIFGIINTTECLLINQIYLIYSNLVLTGTSIRLCILPLQVSAKDPYPTLHTFLSDFCEGYSKCCFDSETGSYHHISAQHCILPLRVSAKGHLPTLHTFLSDFCEGWWRRYSDVSVLFSI